MPRASAVTLPTLKLCKFPSCGEIATGHDGSCFAHSRRKDLNSYTASPRPRGSVKNPMGIEIECYNPDTVYKVTHVASCVSSDGSLPRNGGEIKLCCPEKKMEDAAADVVQRSRMVGNKVDKSCGLHLHFKRPDFYMDNMALDRLAKFCKAVEGFIFDIVPRSRKNNGYCTKLGYAENLFSHYSWFSISSRHPTYEIRIHSGTMNPWKIKGWVNAWVQTRPMIDKIIVGEQGWDDILESFKNDGFLRNLKRDSIGHRYINARKDSGGALTRFGF